MRCSTIVVASLGPLLAASAFADRPPIVISGTYVHHRTHRPIAGARVELSQRLWGFPLEPAGPVLATTRTDHSGRFHFEGPWRGRFYVWCFGREHGRSGVQTARGAAAGIRIEGSTVEETDLDNRKDLTLR